MAWASRPRGAVLPGDPGRDDRLHRDRDGLEPLRGGARPLARDPEGHTLSPGRSTPSTSRCRPSRSRRCPSRSGRDVPDAPRGSRRRTAASRTTRCSAWWRTSGSRGDVPQVLEIYVGVLAATILFIATNAGVIGASRITYSMASYRQLPEVFRRLHPRFKTPWLALVLFAGVAPIIAILPGQNDLPRDDLLVRGDALVHGRARLDRGPAGAATGRGAGLPRAAQPAVARRRLAAVRDLRRARHGPCLARRGVQEPPTRWAGLGWLVVGFAVYFFYRRRVVGISALETVRAPALVLGPSLELEYREIIVPVTRIAESEEALVAAARLAAERRATVGDRPRAGGADGALRSTPSCPRPSGRPTTCSRRPGRWSRLRGARGHPARARPQRRAGDRRGGRAPRGRADGDRRPRGGSRAGGRRSSAPPPSTS